MQSPSLLPDFDEPLSVCGLGNAPRVSMLFNQYIHAVVGTKAAQRACGQSFRSWYRCNNRFMLRFMIDCGKTCFLLSKRRSFRPAKGPKNVSHGASLSDRPTGYPGAVNGCRAPKRLGDKSGNSVTRGRGRRTPRPPLRTWWSHTLCASKTCRRPACTLARLQGGRGGPPYPCG